MKHAEVEYIESGTFQGGEEDVFTAGIKYGEKCVVLTKKNFDLMMVADGEARHASPRKAGSF